MPGFRRLWRGQTVTFFAEQSEKGVDAKRVIPGPIPEGAKVRARLSGRKRRWYKPRSAA